MSAKSWVIVVLLTMLVIVQFPRLLITAYLNAASHELIESTSDASILFPYALTVEDLTHTRNAVMLADQGLLLNPESERLACVRLRAEISAMDWQAAWATAREYRCDDVSLRVRRAPWAAIQVVKYLQQGDRDAARLQFHRALAGWRFVLGLVQVFDKVDIWSEFAVWGTGRSERFPSFSGRSNVGA